MSISEVKVGLPIKSMIILGLGITRVRVIWYIIRIRIIRVKFRVRVIDLLLGIIFVHDRI